MQGNITDWGKEVKKGLIEHGWSINDLAERMCCPLNGTMQTEQTPMI